VQLFTRFAASLHIMENRLAILTGHSLLADGLISRFREYSSLLDVQVFDIAQPDILAVVKEFQPLAIILDKDASQQYEDCSLKNILTTFPNITVIYLHLAESSVQVILSEQFVASGVRELIEIIHSFNDHLKKVGQKIEPWPFHHHWHEQKTNFDRT